MQLDDLGLCIAPEFDAEVDALLQIFFGRFVNAQGEVRDTVTHAPGWVVDCADALRMARAARLRKDDEKRKMDEDFKARFKR